MPDRMRRISRVERDGRRTQEAAQEATKAREQASRSQGVPDAGRVSEEAKRPTITLQTGAVVDAREAASVWRNLASLLEVFPDRFRSLLAIAQGRPGDADATHFESLWADDCLEMDQRTIRPVVQEVLRNSYVETKGVIAPLRLKDEADRPIAEQALAERDRWLRDFASGKKLDWLSRD